MDAGSPTIQARGGGYEMTPEQIAAAIQASSDNERLSDYLYIICGAVSAAVILWKIFDVTSKWVRTVVCVNDDHQRYFAQPRPKAAFIKENILYAPIFRKRHNREIQLSSAINVGTLPSRFQLLFLVAYFATNVVFCCIDLNFSLTYEEVARLLRNRTGVLSVVNMIPLFLLAGRNNPLITLLGISFDTYNLIHRWMGRIVVLEAVAHTLAHLAKGGWGDAVPGIFASPFLLWGFIATIAFVFLSIQAWSPIRHAFYEVFKILHIAVAALSLVGLWYHIKLGELDQMRYLYAVMGLWVADRGARLLRLVYNNIGLRTRTRTVLEALPGDTVRVTMTLARPWHARPGQHAYLYFPTMSLWQSHPFSVSWVDDTDDVTSDRLASNHQDRAAMRKMQVAFVIRARTGFTNTLYQKVAKAPDGRMDAMCFVEGPYGVCQPLDSYGTVVLFAGGVGITHQVPYIKELIQGYAQGKVATRKITLVWTIPSPEHLEWIRPWMTSILSMDKRRDILRVSIFVTNPRSTKEIHSPSSTVQMFPGRPNIETLLSREQEQQVGSCCVTVCGPGALADEVRRVVRSKQSRSSMDFIEEAFSW